MKEINLHLMGAMLVGTDVRILTLQDPDDEELGCRKYVGQIGTVCGYNMEEVCWTVEFKDGYQDSFFLNEMEAVE